MHHRLDLGLGVEGDAGALPRAADEIVQHALDVRLADIGDGVHRTAQLAHLVGLELLEDRRGLLLAHQHHQHRGTFGTGKSAQRDLAHCAVAFIMSRTASAARAGLSRVKPRTLPIRSS